MRLRAPRRDEAQAVLDVIVAADVASIGRPDCTLQDVLDDWALPDLDLAADVFVVEDDDGRLIGWPTSTRAPPGWLSIRATWAAASGRSSRHAIERRMRERGFPVTQAIIAANTAAAEHLREAGWERVQVYRRLRAELAGGDVPPPLDAPVRRFDLAAGLTTAELSVAGTNAAATGLYESAGMTAQFGSERWQLREPASETRRTSASRAW